MPWKKNNKIDILSQELSKNRSSLTFKSTVVISKYKSMTSKKSPSVRPILQEAKTSILLSLLEDWTTKTKGNLKEPPILTSFIFT